MAMRLVKDERTSPRRVDFFANASDLLCFALASAGLYTKGIQEQLEELGIHLTLSQIQYRILQAERDRAKYAPTQRTLFRQGKGAVAKALVGQVVANRGLGATVKSTVVKELEKRDLYTPRAKGVLKNKVG